METWNPTHGRYQDEAVLHERWSNMDFGGEDRLSKHDFPRSPAAPVRDRSHRKRNVCLVVVLAVLLVMLFSPMIAVPVAALERRKVKDDDPSDDGGGGTPNDNDCYLSALSAACVATRYPSVCYSSLSGFVNESGSSRPQDLAKYAVLAASCSVADEIAIFEGSVANYTGPAYANVQAAARDCLEFLQDSSDSLSDALHQFDSFNVLDADEELANLQTWVSAAFTSQGSCMDGLNDLNLGPASGEPFGEFLMQANYSAMLISNGLAFVASLKGISGDLPNLPGHRRLLKDDSPAPLVLYGIINPLRRHLLQTTNFTPNVVVAQDGSGNFTKIQAAVDQASVVNNNYSAQYVIHIKAGTYFETVVVNKSKTNIMFVGDGTGKTIISGNMSVIGSNVSTSSSATLSIQAKNFVGRHFTVQNTAGPSNRQAVAMKVTGDYCAFQNCEFLGFQDTLFTHTNRQFYQDCKVQGTVDFIFGNAAVIFQNSQILATTGLIGQENTYTASSRSDPNQNTGIILQQCTFGGTANLTNARNGTFPTYLGRPWKIYARTVVMQSVESSVLNPAGWLLWNGRTQNLSTIFYGEYNNTGSGSNTSQRVSWSRQINNTQAQAFTVDAFIQGKSWLPQIQISYSNSV